MCTLSLFNICVRAYVRTLSYYAPRGGREPPYGRSDPLEDRHTRAEVFDSVPQQASAQRHCRERGAFRGCLRTYEDGRTLMMMLLERLLKQTRVAEPTAVHFRHYLRALRSLLEYKHGLIQFLLLC